MNTSIDVLRPFGQTTAQGIVSKTRQARDKIAASYANDPKAWAEDEPHFRAQGISGTSQFDHCEVARNVMGRLPELREVFGYNAREVWCHVEAVIRGRGYKMSRGYVIGHVEDDELITSSSSDAA